VVCFLFLEFFSFVIFLWVRFPSSPLCSGVGSAINTCCGYWISWNKRGFSFFVSSERRCWLVLSVKSSWVWTARDLSNGFHMVHGFCFHEASARFEGGFLAETLVPIVERVFTLCYCWWNARWSLPWRFATTMASGSLLGQRVEGRAVSCLREPLCI